MRLLGPIFRITANLSTLYRSWQSNKLNEQSELKRAFQLALVLADSEPRINVTVSIEGKLQRGWRRYKFGSSKDRPEPVQVELRPRTSELAATIDALKAEMARLNTLTVPEEHTALADTAPAVTAPASDLSTDGENLPGLLQQQLDI